MADDELPRPTLLLRPPQGQAPARFFIRRMYVQAPQRLLPNRSPVGPHTVTAGSCTC